MLSLETCFGLSSSRPKGLMFYPLFVMKITILILFPYVSFELIQYSRKSNLQNGVPVSDITIRARALTFSLSWLFMLFVYISEYQNLQPLKIYNFLLDLIRMQNLRENISTLIQYFSKFLVVDVVLVKFNYDKFVHWKKDELTLLESISVLPYIVMAFASNRIFIANTIVNQHLKILTRNQQPLDLSNELETEKLMILRSHLHKFFVEFNKSNAVNLIACIGFCIFNVVYQVC